MTGVGLVANVASEYSRTGLAPVRYCQCRMKKKERFLAVASVVAWTTLGSAVAFTTRTFDDFPCRGRGDAQKDLTSRAFELHHRFLFDVAM